MGNARKPLAASDHTLYEAFWEGFVDYRQGLRRNPYDLAARQDVEARAWDRGQEASRRINGFRERNGAS